MRVWGLTQLYFSSKLWSSSSRLNPLLMYIHVTSQEDMDFFSPAISDISCVPAGCRAVSDACTYNVTWKIPQLNGCEMEPPVIYCAWSPPCRSVSADTYGGSPFHLLLAGCRGLLPSVRGGPGGPGCTVVVANSWVGRGAAELHGGGSAGARAGSFQWQHRGAGDRLIKTLADGLGYGTHVYAWLHDAHLRQLAAWEKDVDLGREWGPGWGACRGQQGEQGPEAAWWALESPGTLQGGHQPWVCLPSLLQKEDNLQLQTEPRALPKSSAYGVQPCWGKLPGQGSKNITCPCSRAASFHPRATQSHRSAAGCLVPPALCLYHVVRSGAWPLVSYVLCSQFALGNWGEALTFSDKSMVQE